MWSFQTSHAAACPMRLPRKRACSGGFGSRAGACRDALFGIGIPGLTRLLIGEALSGVLCQIETTAVIRRPPRSQRSLTTVLFTDIVGSTEMAAERGDRRWRELLAQHHEFVRHALKRFGGREVDTAGDGF